MITERRKRTRVPVSFDLNIVVRGERIKVKTQNISMTGVSFISPQPFHVNDRCKINLRLNDDIHLSIEAKILRSREGETIASFLEMDEDSFYHLKRLLQYNAADSDQIEKELEKPAFT
ncbi:MAG: PilZ domain-containing protein [Deltaproteobacteria bacterium]